MSPADALLVELRRSGIQLEPGKGVLHYRPQHAVSPELRQRMAVHKGELLALLRAEDLGGGHRPAVDRCPICRECDFTRPRTGGAWRCARCRPYDLSGSEIEWWPRVVGAPVPIEELLGGAGVEESGSAPTAPCRCCGSTIWWRLKRGGPWVCPRCHPPRVPREAIETWEAAP